MVEGMTRKEYPRDGLETLKGKRRLILLLGVRRGEGGVLANRRRTSLAVLFVTKRRMSREECAKAWR